MRLLVVGVALMAAVVAAACGKEAAPVAPRPTATPTLQGSRPIDGVEVTDMVSREVTVPEEVRRVVALSPAALEYAAAFDIEIVGRASDATYPPEAAGAPEVGSTNSPDFTAIAALEPDVVIADAVLQSARLKDFNQFVYPVFLIRIASYEDSLEGFRVLGELFGQQERADELIGEVEGRLDAAKESIAGRPQPTVLILTGSGRDVYAGSDESYVGSLVKALGATNVLGAQPQGAPIVGFGLVEVEQAATTSPDIVLLVASEQSDLPAQIEASVGWAATPAVRNGRVISLDPAVFLRSPGARVGEAIAELARVMYP